MKLIPIFYEKSKLLLSCYDCFTRNISNNNTIDHCSLSHCEYIVCHISDCESCELDLSGTLDLPPDYTPAQKYPVSYQEIELHRKILLNMMV